MGNPRKIRRKYDTPIHPWIKSRIEDERRLAKTFGTKNKNEIWRMETVLKKFKSQAKHLIAASGSQADIEREHLLRRVKSLGLLGSADVSFDKILGLTLDDVLARRLQTVVFKKGLARSVKQARQFITHEHILVDGRTVTSPSYLVTVSEESGVEFTPNSSLYSEEHPERASPEDKENVKGKAPKMDEEVASKDSKESSKKESSESKSEEESKSTPEPAKKADDSSKDKGENQLDSIKMYDGLQLISMHLTTIR